MWEKNLGQKVLLIVGVLVVAAFLLIRYDRTTGDWYLKLRGGLDIEGGVSMIYEINDTGMEDDPRLAEDMKTLLQRRVDPSGVYGLEWRVHGRNRIEIQMPLPPVAAKQRELDYQTARNELFAASLKRSELEAALRMPDGERAAELERLAGGSAQRLELMQQAAQRYDAYRAQLDRLQAARTDTAQIPEGQDLRDLELSARDAQDLWEDAVDAVLARNLDPTRFDNILALGASSSSRKPSIEALKTEFPKLSEQIDDVVAKYDQWDSVKGKLDGPADLQRLLQGAGVLEFRILTEVTPENAARIARYREQLKEFGPAPRPGDTDGWFKVDNPVAFFNLRSEAELKTFDPAAWRTAAVEKYNENYYVLSSLDERQGLLHGAGGAEWKLRNAQPSRDQSGRPNVQFQFDAVGAARFSDLTERNVGRQLCILVDGVAYSSATIQERIGATGTINGDFSIDKINYLVQTMKAGALPARLKDTPLSERTIGSSLGQQNLRQALRAGIIGLLMTAAFMIVYYFTCGLVANVALMMNVLLTLAVMAMLEASFTLAGIAGVILTIGMVVDANVLIYERMREEKERGSSLRMIIKNGYDKALSTIVDANITTLLTSLILYYVGSEEIKGFGLTLGWGIVISLFTSLFVTRTIFTLLVKYRLLRDIRMLKLISVPHIDWYGLRRFFLPASAIVIAGGLFAVSSLTREQLFDVEFNGGVAAEVELKQPIENENVLQEKLRAVAQSLATKRDAVASATVTASGVNTFLVRVPETSANLSAALITEPLEDEGWLVRGGVNKNVGDEQVEVRLDGERTAAEVQQFVRDLATKGLGSVDRTLGRANIGIVLDADQANRGKFWNITTTEKNKRLVQYALEQAVGDQLVRQPQISYVFHGEDENTPYPIVDSRLESVVPGLPGGAGADVTDFRGGAAMWFDELDPPQSLPALKQRLQAMRLQPGYQEFPYRPVDVVGVRAAEGRDDAGNPLYESVVVLVGDPPFRYADDPDRWAADFAQKELQLAQATFDTEQSLRRVSQFKPAIAAQATRRAITAIVFSWLMIIAYLWVRFGRVSYGVAGVMALVHDVLVVLGFIGFAHWFASGGNPIARAMLIGEFKIDMTVIAAFLTIIGYSINDTIVIFDRIREVRGRLGYVTPEIINDSLNQTMSRTIITGLTTVFVLGTMYAFGGESIRGFNYCMLIGVFVGTYSSVAIAAPLLLFGTQTGPPRATTKA